MRAKSNIEKQVEEFVSSPPETPADDRNELERNKQEIRRDNLLSSGSALLNLACTDNPYGAFIPGRYYLLVGASSAGKTWTMLSIAAESTLHEKFKNYKIGRAHV